MALIKRADHQSRARGAAVLDLVDVGAQAQALEAEARVKAGAILDEARRERERLLSTAHAEGLARGHAEGLAKGLEEGREQGFREAVEKAAPRIEAVSVAWREAIGAFELRTRAMMEAADDAFVELAIELASRIVKRAIELNPEAVVDQARAALAMVNENTRVVVMVHPEDLPIVELAWPMLIERLGSAERATLRADAMLERGSCIVRTGERGQGLIDARITTQLARMAEAIMPEAKHAGPRGPAGESGAAS
jgi:flagellar assembly protein FliH